MSQTRKILFGALGVYLLLTILVSPSPGASPE